MLKKGHGKTKPKPSDRVQVHYSAWTSDGTLFDSSVARGKPASLPLSRVIPGWSEGLQLMVEGDKALFWIPEQLAYRGRAGSPRGALVYEVELLQIAPADYLPLRRSE
jgi:peptidylprolyl isomerase